MTPEEVLTRLTTMTAAESEPALSAIELDELVRLARRADTSGREIDDDDWTPTYDLNAAAAIGWTWKAGKAASDVTFNTDGQGFSMSHLFDHCERMAKRYASRAAYTITVTSALAASQEV